MILDRASAVPSWPDTVPSLRCRKGNDFATEVDLALERQIVAELEAATGIGVHGEEFGGADLGGPWCGFSIRSTAPSTTPPVRRWPPSCSACCATGNRLPD